MMRGTTGMGQRSARIQLRGRRSVVGLVLAGALALASAPTAAAAASTGASAKDDAEPIATLAISAERVEIRRAGGDAFKVAKDGAKLREGDTVRTDATGQAEIEYGDDAYTRLDVDTTFTIESLTDDEGNRQVQGTLESGKTWNRTVALTESESFEQTGAGATAAVEGTAFAVECTAVDHCVFTAIIHDTTLTGEDGDVRLLTPLDQCDSTSGELCGDITQIPADELPQWIADNLLRDLVERGIDDGPLSGIIVVDVAGTVVFRATPPTTQPSGPPAPTVPGAPTGVSAIAGDGSATVFFSSPASDGGSSITSYSVFATGGAATSSVSASASASGPGSPIVVGGLANGSTYTFTVVATNAVGAGPGSAPSNAVTPATTPDAPTAVHAVVAGYAAAQVTVTPPADDGGADVTSYTVSASGGGSCVANAPATSCTVTGLSTGPQTFSATATNVAGTSGPSGASNAVTPPVVVSGVASWLVAPSAPAVGWETTGFDDSGWTPSDAPFQKTPVTACPAFPPGSSPFPLGSTLYLRHTFELPNGATGVVMVGTIDNTARIWINGQQVGGLISSGSCVANGINVAIPDSYLTAGENVIAVEATDDGSTAAYFSLEVAFAAPEAAVVPESTPVEPVEPVEPPADEPPAEPGA
jgi:hypothetical protein